MGFESGKFRARRIWDLMRCSLILKVALYRTPIGRYIIKLYSQYPTPKYSPVVVEIYYFFYCHSSSALRNFQLFPPFGEYLGGTQFTSFILDSARTMHWPAESFINQEQCGKCRRIWLRNGQSNVKICSIVMEYLSMLLLTPHVLFHPHSSMHFDGRHTLYVKHR